MKKLLGILSLFPLFLFAQEKNFPRHAAEFSMNYSHVGLNTISAYRYALSPKFELSFGAKILLNQPVRDNRGFAYRHRFYAVKIGEHFGLTLGIERKLTVRESCIEPFVGVVFQGTVAHTRQYNEVVDSAMVWSPDTTTIAVITSRYMIIPEKIFALEGILSGGFTVKAYKNVSLRLAIGISYVYMLQEGNSIHSSRYKKTWEFGDYYSVGIVYHFKNCIAGTESK
jgi:hypothetical protein